MTDRGGRFRALTLDLDGMTLDEIAALVDGWPPTVVRAKGYATIIDPAAGTSEWHRIDLDDGRLTIGPSGVTVGRGVVVIVVDEGKPVTAADLLP